MNTVHGNVVAIGDKVIVHNMHFGEQKSSGGIVILGDDGKDRGIYARWGQVFAKGPDNKDEYQVGDWILVEHGRWTRGIVLETPDGLETTIRMVDNNCILAWAREKPNDLHISKTLDVPAPIEEYRI